MKYDAGNRLGNIAINDIGVHFQFLYLQLKRDFETPKGLNPYLVDESKLIHQRGKKKEK